MKMKTFRKYKVERPTCPDELNSHRQQSKIDVRVNTQSAIKEAQLKKQRTKLYDVETLEMQNKAKLRIAQVAKNIDVQLHPL